MIAGAAVALIFLGVAAAEPSALDAILRKMEAAEQTTRTLTFQFTQTADIALTGETQKVQGSAVFQKPDKFRIEHKSPAPQTVVSDGKTLWFFNPAQNQVLVDSWENWARSAGFPKGLLPFQENVRDLKTRYSLSFEKKARVDVKSTVVLRMTPREESPWPYQFRVWVDERSGYPVMTELESKGVKAVTRITRLKINPDLDEKAFVLDIPKDADVLGSPALPSRVEPKP